MKVLEFDFRAETQSTSLAAPKAETLTIFLHGFPGIRSKQNRDIAEEVMRQCQGRGLLVLYSGLGHAPGKFVFERCRDEAVAFFQGVVSAHEGMIDLVGHSWGGFLSLLLAQERPARIRRIVLLSPLLDFTGINIDAPSFASSQAANPHLGLGDTAVLAQDFWAVGRSHTVEDLVAMVPTDVEVLFLQAKEDPITLTPTAERMQALFRGPISFELIDTDHSFVTNRPLITQRIGKFLSADR